MNIYIFDTDVLIDILRNKQDTIRKIYELTQNAPSVCCSCITVAEIFAGMKPHEETLTKRLLHGLRKFPVTEEIAELGGKLKEKTKSHILFLDDCLIAATTIFHRGTLVTKDVKYYPFRELSVEEIS